MLREESFESMFEIVTAQENENGSLEKEVVEKVINNIQTNFFEDVIFDNGDKTFKNISKRIKTTKVNMTMETEVINKIINSFDKNSIVVKHNGEETFENVLDALFMLSCYAKDLVA